VCFNFCRTLEHMNFFGVLNANDCYCAPYYKAKVGGEDTMCDSACEGNNAQMCGGIAKTDVYEMHMCNDVDQDIQRIEGKLKAAEAGYVYESANLLEA